MLGAGGFVGARLVEMAALSGRTDVFPVVRAFRSVARSAHLGVPYRLGDPARTDSLTEALVGCDTLVNLTTGDPTEMLSTTKSIYAAAVGAGVRLLVHISSALVYAGIERPDLPDDAPPRLDHWMPYARAKAQSEIFLRERMGDGRLAIVVLRPSLVWGPGSPWVLAPAHELVSGSAYLVGGGAGVCGLLYVDNLVRCIDMVVAHRAVRSDCYNLADLETTTWREYYGALAEGLGVDPSGIHEIPGDRYRAGSHDWIEAIQGLRPYQQIKDRFSLETRAGLKLRLRRALGRGVAPSPDAPVRPLVKRLQWEMQTTPCRLPTEKFGSVFGDIDWTTFDEGLASSLAWLRFLGVDQRELLAPPLPTGLGPSAFAAG